MKTASSEETLPPLHSAVWQSNADAVRRLLQQGAAVDASAAHLADSVMPLHIAAQLGHAAVAELLLDAGAPVDAETARWSETPLGLAIKVTGVRSTSVSAV